MRLIDTLDNCQDHKTFIYWVSHLVKFKHFNALCYDSEKNNF